MSVKTEQSKWAGRRESAERLGITASGMALLQRDNQLPPDCVPCGKIIWRIAELDMKRDQVREYLRQAYPQMVDELFISD